MNRTFFIHSQTALRSKGLIRIYNGSQSTVIRQFKFASFVFANCALISVPFLLFYSHAPILSSSAAAMSAVIPMTFIHQLTRHYVHSIDAYGKEITPSSKLLFIKSNILGKALSFEVQAKSIRVMRQRFTLKNWEACGEGLFVETGNRQGVFGKLVSQVEQN